MRNSVDTSNNVLDNFHCWTLRESPAESLQVNEKVSLEVSTSNKMSQAKSNLSIWLLISCIICVRFASTQMMKRQPTSWSVELSNALTTNNPMLSYPFEHLHQDNNQEAINATIGNQDQLAAYFDEPQNSANYLQQQPANWTTSRDWNAQNAIRAPIKQSHRATSNSSSNFWSPQTTKTNQQHYQQEISDQDSKLQLQLAQLVASNYQNPIVVPTSSADQTQLSQVSTFDGGQELVQTLNNYLTLESINKLAASKQQQQPAKQTARANLWFRRQNAPKRRSFEPQQSAPYLTRLSPVEDAAELMSRSYSDHDLGLSKDAQSSFASLPLLYESSPTVEVKSIKPLFEDASQASADNLVAASKYSAVQHTPTVHAIYATYPAAFASHKVKSRKGLEKSLGIPVLVGIGAGLLSFLIVSNLFLSIPLLAVTLMNFLNGNNMFAPNQNQNPAQPASNNQTPTTNQLGRKRRDLSSQFPFEANIQRAIENLRLD